MNNCLEITECRICKSNNLQTFLDLGMQPLANSFITKEEIEKEQFFPLDVCFCRECGLVQLRHLPKPEAMFNTNYAYIPSTSITMQRHFSELAKELCKKLKLSQKALVVDIGSNDGLLLEFFKREGMNVLGIDPSKNVAELAEKRGVKTITSFFNQRVAKEIVENHGKAELILGTNVFAHVQDLHEFMKGISELLSEEGFYVIEHPYLLDLIKNKEFDTIYHEHASYFSIKPLLRLFKEYDMEIIEVQKINIHGGSIRVFVRKKGINKVDTSINELVSLEEKFGLYNEETYRKFASDVELIRNKLLDLLKKIKKDGKKIIGYGAPAKGTVLLNYCKIGKELLEYIVDSVPYKQGKYSPGMHIPIFPENKLSEDNPDYALVLAWNFAEEIKRKNTEFRKRGGKFIIPIPEPKIYK